MDQTSQRMLMGSAGHQTTPPGQQAYTTGGTYSWICPPGVTSVSVVCVGAGGQGAYDTRSTKTDYGGGGGGGGELRYKNNITVVPGQSYQVDVAGIPSVPSATRSAGANGGPSRFNINTVVANGGLGGQLRTLGGAGGAGGSGGIGDGGGNGGAGGSATSSTANASGGGAGGYSGNGGKGADKGVDNATNGSGGGGGGGGYSSSAGQIIGGGGGGVGILGQGISGNKGNSATGSATGGFGGSGGWNGGTPSGGQEFGGGMGGTYAAGIPGGGAVRIIWPGDVRQFPSTNTGDV